MDSLLSHSTSRCARAGGGRGTRASACRIHRQAGGARLSESRGDGALLAGRVRTRYGPTKRVDLLFLGKFVCSVAVWHAMVNSACCGQRAHLFHRIVHPIDAHLIFKSHSFTILLYFRFTHHNSPVSVFAEVMSQHIQMMEQQLVQTQTASNPPVPTAVRADV
jgi:hypothetical protein